MPSCASLTISLTPPIILTSSLRRWLGSPSLHLWTSLDIFAHGCASLADLRHPKTAIPTSGFGGEATTSMSSVTFCAFGEIARVGVDGLFDRRSCAGSLYMLLGQVALRLGAASSAFSLLQGAAFVVIQAWPMASSWRC